VQGVFLSVSKEILFNLRGGLLKLLPICLAMYLPDFQWVVLGMLLMLFRFKLGIANYYVDL